MNTGLDQYMDIFKDAVEDVHGNTKKDKFHPNGEVWLAC